MRCASALSTLPRTEAAFRDVLDRVAMQLDAADRPQDFAAVFATPHHAEALGRLAAEIRERELGWHVLGCTAEWVVGEGREIEGEPAVCLWSIQLPGAAFRPMRLTRDELTVPGPIGTESTAGAPADGRLLLLLGDPFSFPSEEWLSRLGVEKKALRVAGGMASGGGGPGQNVLLLDDRVFHDGAVGMLIDAPGEVVTVVSQGCRPIGRPMIVTKAEGNLIRELGRRPALEVLREQFAALGPDDQELVQQGLHIGRVINEYQESFHRGDFLVRNVVGADDSGALAITDAVRVGQTVQFHVRDAETADQDLRALVEAGRPSSPPAGALLFTCNGRGTRMFPGPGHDVGVLRELLGPIPVAGFFAMGELGPVGGQNFLHGFTASAVVFAPTGTRGE